MSARLRILNGRFIGDSLGYFTCITPSGYNAVDYAVVSESLLSSVEYFRSGDFTHISDHVQIEFFLKCNIDNVNLKHKLPEDFTDILSYKRNKKSYDLLLQSLETDELRNNFIDFEFKPFSLCQEEIDEACTDLTNIFYKKYRKTL